VGDPQAFDVIIAGGGMAGGSVAAALDRLGLRTLVVEPGLDSSKRLAGELIHPPGAANLAELGLLGSLEAAGGAPVLGFAVVGDGQSHRLPYASLGTLRLTGFAMEHAAIASTLRAAVARLPHVAVWDGARVVAVHLGAPEAVGVTISRRGDYTKLNARLLVAADGAVLEDFGSKNGTFRGSERVITSVPLADGDTIHVGSLLVTFHVRASLMSTDTQA